MNSLLKDFAQEQRKLKSSGFAANVPENNYFSPKTTAERFAKGRPFFHPFVVRRIKEFLYIKELLLSALDVGCGTGFSTVALKEIAREIVGVDAAQEMVVLARKESGVSYLLAHAENLPFGVRRFDLITLSQTFHWLNRDKFLTEASRLLRRGGWLVVYDDYFSGRLSQNPENDEWHRRYLEKYPSTPRRKIEFTTENTGKFGFRFVKEERLENSIEFSSATLIDFLLTQSNVIAKVEEGGESLETAEDFLRNLVSPLFKNAEKKEFSFDAPIWYLQFADER